jgi:uncharacterized protein involved in exopolysaccharide biosynthesis
MSTCPKGASAAMLIVAKEANLDDGTYDFESEDSGAKPRRPGLPVEPRRLLSILAEDRKPLLIAFLVASAVALCVSFFLPKTYESSAHLLYESTELLKLEGKEPTPGAFVDSAIVPSRLRDVRERLNWDISLKELGSRVDAVLEDKATMRIVGRASTAEDARALAQTVLDVFLERQAKFNEEKLESLTAENQAALTWAKEGREAARQAYEEFRKKSGKSDLLHEKEQLLARSATLRASADEAAVDVAAQRARIAELEKAQRDLPRQIVASATKGSPVDSPLAQARSELAAARASLSDQHPTVRALKERVASLQAQRGEQKAELGEETLAANPARAVVDQQLATARAALAGATEREAALRVLLKANKSEAESLAPEEGEARQVIGELEQAERRVDELLERSAALRDAQMGQLVGFRVLSAPMLPEESKRSRVAVVMLMTLPIVTVLIVALVSLVRRLRGLTVEAPREVAWWGNGPVLGTSVWPRDPAALDSFVDELEDHGVYGAGRTLVVPATEVERDIACSFAMRLAEAPWLAAAILDVGARADADVHVSPLVTPSPGAPMPPRRLSSQATPSVSPGRVIMTPDSRPPTRPTPQGLVPPPGSSTSPPPTVTPPPKSGATSPSSSRPPHKQTMIGLPAVRAYGAVSISTEPPAVQENSSEENPSNDAGGPQPFRRKRGARATVRMVVPVHGGTVSEIASGAPNAQVEEEAFLLTRPVPVVTDQTPSRTGPVAYASADSPDSSASNAVMRAAVRLLGNNEDEVTSLRRSAPPGRSALGDVTAVALAWNGPLSGPLLRRAARLAHRVMVVVSSGASVIDLARIKTRLGRDTGVGYVLVNVRDAYVDLHDRVGSVEDFWEDPKGEAAKDSTPA